MEFAAVVPILLIIMIGIIDFGRAMYAYHFVASAARQATRWAGVRGSQCNPNYMTQCPATAANILSYVQSLAPPGLPTSTASCTSATVYCLTINESTSFIWPGTTTTSGSSTSCTSSGNSSNAPGCVVQVQVTYTWNSGIPLIPYTLVMSSTSDWVISN